MNCISPYVLKVIKYLTSSVWWGVCICKTAQEMCLKCYSLGTSERS